MFTKTRTILSVLTLLGIGSSASAQGAWSAPPPPSSAYPSRPVEPYDPPSPAKQQAMHRGYQGAFHIAIPLFLDVDRDIVRPGADLNIFGAYDMGYVAFGLGAGVMWNPIDLDAVPGVSAVGRQPMTRLYLAPEFRVQVPNISPIMPYLGITFDANWWRVNQTEIVCGAFYCTGVAVFRFTPGMTVKLGLAFRVLQGTYLDFGVKYSLSGPGSFFEGREQWVSPYFGMLFR